MAGHRRSGCYNLLGLLQQRPVWTGPELAERLGVTARTVRRDVERLRALGYPVHASQGVGGGYQLGAGRTCRRCCSTTRRRSPRRSRCRWPRVARSPAPSEAALRALAKLDQVLPAGCAHEVRALSRRGGRPSAGGRVEVDAEMPCLLARACRDEVGSSFDYTAGRRGADGAGSSPTAWSPPTGAGTCSPTTSTATTGAVPVDRMTDGPRDDLALPPARGARRRGVRAALGDRRARTCTRRGSWCTRPRRR